MFGFKNFTDFSFVSKFGKYSMEFASGVIEEVTFNITASGVANAAEISENLNLNLPAKDQIIATASVAVNSKIVQSNVLGLIAGATPNLLI